MANRAVVWLGVLGWGFVLLLGCEDPAHQPPAGVTLENPYQGGGAWYKANFHLHSTHSHGLLSAAELVDLYGRNGYGILSITDHNQYGDQDGGALPGVFQVDSVVHDWNGDGVIHPDHVYGSGVEAYVRDWDREPPPWQKDRWFRPAGASIDKVPLVLSGFEASYSYFGAHFGLLGFPPGAIAAPQAGFEWLARSKAAGGFAYIAHPREGNAMATRFAAALPVNDFDGLEIVNGAQLTGAPVAGALADATPLWDSLLTRGCRLWGLANDDAHYPPGAAEQFPFSAFDVVLCPEPTVVGVLAALHRGAFFASTGLQFEELRLDGLDLRVRVPGAQWIRFIGAGGRLLEERSGDSAVYGIRGDEGYVRVEASGDLVRAPLNTWLRSAWTQPFRISSRARPSP